MPTEANVDTERALEEENKPKCEHETEEPPKPPVLPAPQIIATPSLIIFSVVFILHSFIAGLAIGAFDNVEDIGLIAVLVIFQKITISFSFGVMFLSAGRLCGDLLTVLFGFLFVVATPIGIGIMWGEGDEGLRKIDPVMLII